MIQAILRILLISSMLGGLQCSPAIQQPAMEDELTIGEPIFSVDRIIDGAVIEIAIPIKNEGSRPLQIHHMKTNCVCLLPQWYKKQLKPKQEEVILLDYYSKNKGRAEGEKRFYELNIWVEGEIQKLDFNLTVYNN